MSTFPSRLRAAIILSALAPIAVAASSAHAEPPAFGSCEQATTAPAPVVDALDNLMAAFLQSGFGSAPGAVLSVRTPEWRYVKSAGSADLDAGTPVDCAMPFQIGSNTKMMTATVLLQLQEEGKLSVDDKLSRYLPAVAARLTNGEDMTLRQLARHTSGVFSYTDNAPDGTPGLMEADTTDRQALVRHLTPPEMVDFVVEHGQPDFAPGADGAWHYSNTGYILLGMIIEKLEGKPIGKSFETRIFAPLGMNDTYLWDDTPRADFGLPRAYLGAPFDYETTDWNMSQGGAAGAVVSTPDDMHVFIEALVAGELFESAETLALMQETVRTDNITLIGYGLGLALKGDGLWGHGGQTLGFLSDIVAAKDHRISFVVWASSSKNAVALGASAIADALSTLGVLPE